MNDMREEFEDWCLRENGFTPDRSAENDGYRFGATDDMWRAWKASRAALVVELPPQWFSRNDNEEVMSAIGVIESLDGSGVRHE